MYLVFISSPQSEFEHERRELCYFILTDPYLKQYFDVFLFENLPANEQSPKNNYQDKVEESSIILGLFGETYGTPDINGISATEHEFNLASELGKDCIVFLKDFAPETRQEVKMSELIAKVKEDVTYEIFRSLDELKLKVMRSLLFWQQKQSSMEEK
ncbi:MAG: DUF4062 domain-containing protein [Deltaproteobacteria bacterium]|jgi:ATP-dependent DNA helicase RecG|nr:DUF4062 domain-containing protein [Deltaproteobacteria bacterium]MBT4091947.1 DUF4062 domain-containing protein [Deltaproteobacteria bacterium]MBT4262692.1 DUF4062 domain-containing protein [Deltaproteobacteria bacterium]MBT4643237.1 DUF4062 domain-containing protein [Deltaproteobacteria bacterium]MBT6503776.1 DUF4062 domain-containing protein [Deltaproteobacteria bacterium]